MWQRVLCALVGAGLLVSWLVKFTGHGGSLLYQRHGDGSLQAIAIARSGDKQQNFNSARQAVDSTANLIYHRYDFHNNTHVQFFKMAWNIDSRGWDILKYKFAKKLAMNNGAPFVMVFGGSSVTAGYDNYFNQSYPAIFEKRMRPILDMLNVNLVVRNIGQQHVSCKLSNYCFETAAGIALSRPTSSLNEDSASMTNTPRNEDGGIDFVGWENSFSCGSARDVFEYAARLAYWNKAVMHYSASGSFSTAHCKPLSGLVGNHNHNRHFVSRLSEKWAPNNAPQQQQQQQQQQQLRQDHKKQHQHLSSLPSSSSLSSPSSYVYKITDKQAGAYKADINSWHQDGSSVSRFASLLGSAYDTVAPHGFNVWAKSRRSCMAADVESSTSIPSLSPPSSYSLSSSFGVAESNQELRVASKRFSKIDGTEHRRNLAARSGSGSVGGELPDGHIAAPIRTVRPGHKPRTVGGPATTTGHGSIEAAKAATAQAAALALKEVQLRQQQQQQQEFVMSTKARRSSAVSTAKKMQQQQQQLRQANVTSSAAAAAAGGIIRDGEGCKAIDMVGPCYNEGGAGWLTQEFAYFGAFMDSGVNMGAGAASAGKSWHATVGFHLLRGEILAFNYMHILVDAMREVQEARDNKNMTQQESVEYFSGKLDKLQSLPSTGTALAGNAQRSDWGTREQQQRQQQQKQAIIERREAELPKPKFCQSFECERRPTCYTDFEPNYSREGNSNSRERLAAAAAAASTTAGTSSAGAGKSNVALPVPVRSQSNIVSSGAIKSHTPDMHSMSLAHRAVGVSNGWSLYVPPPSEIQVKYGILDVKSYFKATGASKTIHFVIGESKSGFIRVYGKSRQETLENALFFIDPLAYSYVSSSSSSHYDLLSVGGGSGGKVNSSTSTPFQVKQSQLQEPQNVYEPSNRRYQLLDANYSQQDEFVDLGGLPVPRSENDSGSIGSGATKTSFSTFKENVLTIMTSPNHPDSTTSVTHIVVF